MAFQFAKGMFWYYSRLFKDPIKARRLFSALVHEYTAPHRHYHDIQHIDDCLNAYLNSIQNDGCTDPAVIAAILYHDSVYNGVQHEDEAASAQYMVEDLASELPEGVLVDAASQIISTGSYSTCGSFGIMGDCDLARLGGSWASFQEDTALIRQEYAGIPDDKWRTGRGQFLATMLKLPRIYSTPLFFSAYEASARRNLKMALESL